MLNEIIKELNKNSEKQASHLETKNKSLKAVLKSKKLDYPSKYNFLTFCSDIIKQII